MYSRKILNICLTLVIVLSAFGVSTVLAAPTVLYDDFDDNDVTDWDIAPTIIPAGSLSEVYDPALPDVHDGRIWGKGSGYSSPLLTAAVKDVTFDASGSLVVEFMGRSGPQWPNQATVYLMAPSWPDRGEVYAGAGQFNGKIVGAPAEGYMINIYGESNKRVQLARYYFVGDQQIKQWLIQWSYNDVYNDHTYRFERDSEGNWKLFYGDADGSNMQLAPVAPVNDMTYTSFGYVIAEMFRNQSCFDYIRIESESAPKVPVVLVHGYQFNKDITGPQQWGGMKELLGNAGFWVKNNSSGLDYEFDYTEDSGTDTSIGELAEKLGLHIDSVLEDSHADQVDVVAYSMGGLIARQYICDDPSPKVRRLVQIATPNYGLGLATLLATFRHSEQVMEMRYGSDFLYRFHVDSESNVNLSAVDYLTIVGDIEGGLPQDRFHYVAGDGVVDVISAACVQFSDYEHQRVVPYKHYGSIALIDDENHDTFRIVKSFLEGSEDWQSVGSDFAYQHWGAWVSVEDALENRIGAQVMLVRDSSVPPFEARKHFRRNRDDGVYFLMACEEPEGIYRLVVYKGFRRLDPDVLIEGGTVNVLEKVVLE